MAHHLIYVPRGDDAGVHPLDAAGLPDHVAGAESRPIPDGPDGAGGTLFAWRTPGTAGRFHFAAGQTWTPAVPRGDAPARRYWVGTWDDSPPCEADLRRPGTLHGRDVPLANGEAWHVAVPHFLPHDLVLSDDGSIAFEPKRRYQDACLEADRWRTRLAGEQQRVSYAELWALCLRMLSLNYRLPPELASRLRLIDTENVKAVVTAVVDAGGE